MGCPEIFRKEKLGKGNKTVIKPDVDACHRFVQNIECQKREIFLLNFAGIYCMFVMQELHKKLHR